MSSDTEASRTPDASEPEEQTCNRCEKALDSSSANRWCKACQAKYQREHRAMTKQMTESRGYAAGVSAMRAYLAKRFEEYGPAPFSGAEVAHYIRQSKGPLD